MQYGTMIASVVIGISAAALTLSQRDIARENHPADTALRHDLPSEVISEMLRIAQVGPNDHLVDLGSGDRQIVLTAAQQFGATASGFNLSAERGPGIIGRASFIDTDLSSTDLGKATILTISLLPSISPALRARLLNELKPGTRIVSHDADMGDWKPDQHATVDAGRLHHVYYWVVPAKVDGAWTIDTPAGDVPVQLMLRQTYQLFTGTARVGETTVPLGETRLLGNRVLFSLISRGDRGQETTLRFDSRVDGKNMEGSVTVDAVGDQSISWRAANSSRSQWLPEN
ncbi:MAG: SAM-dependent methyltransferase [Pseudomonadota bacterium]